MDKTYWEKEEFEELVARGIIALYENDFHTTKGSPSYLKVSNNEIKKLKEFGIYFTPNDRESFFHGIDEKNDGYEKEYCLADTILNYHNENNYYSDCYLNIRYMRVMEDLPLPVRSDVLGFRKIYKFITYCPSKKGITHVEKSYIVGDINGNFHDCYVFQNGKKINIGMHVISNDIEDKKLSGYRSDIFSCSITAGLYSDRKFLWNVTAVEKDAKAKFGVYPEQIKSLFYSRTLPMTESGRKRPILHWVNCHQRRIKNGIDINIDKYLRGVNSFEMNGTRFLIERPFKEFKDK